MEKFYLCFIEVNNMKKYNFGYKITVLIFVILILNSNFCIAQEENMFKNTGQYNLAIPGFIAEMLQSEYWIKTLKNPDEIILTPREIDIFNKKNFSYCKKLVNLQSIKKVFIS